MYNTVKRTKWVCLFFQQKMPIHKVGISIFLFDIFIYCELKRLPWPNTKAKESSNYFLLLTTKFNKSKDIDTFEMIFVEQNKKILVKYFEMKKDLHNTHLLNQIKRNRWKITHVQKSQSKQYIQYLTVTAHVFRN